MKKILAVIPFEGIYPAMNGGMLRCINLLNQLAGKYEVTAIIHQDLRTFSRSFAEFKALANCRLISTSENRLKSDLFSFLPVRIANALRYRFWKKSLRGPAEENFLRIYPVIKKVMSEESFDYVILEDMVVLPFSKMIRRMQPGAKIVYNAYNVNSRLALAAVKAGTGSQAEYEFTLNTESSLHLLTDAVFACSELDVKQLSNLNDQKIRGFVIPNGVGIQGTRKNAPEMLEERRKNILFCGALDYSPNREGLLWFCREIFPLILEIRPSCKLMVVGKGDPGEELKRELHHPSIQYYGRVESLEPYYDQAMIAVVPLLTGSGTRLKVLEAMGKWVPVVSTRIGAEGIEYQNGKNIVLADTNENFAKAVTQLLSDPKKAESVAAAGFELVKSRYDWNMVGETMVQALNQLVQNEYEVTREIAGIRRA